MKVTMIIFLCGIFYLISSAAQEIGEGNQPQLAVDAHGIIRLVYGYENKIFYAMSNDNGTSFTKPVVMAEVNEMHLGMGRGPQLTSSKDYSVTTAMDKKGNIHSFQLSHKTKKWSKMKNINDVAGSAPEGLMSITADEANHFYAVWLDLRDDKNNKIAFSLLTNNGSWSKNTIVYKSPDKTVCECCKPSVAIRSEHVSLMFRNWINGSRDLYVITSLDGGKTFGTASKLGNGTWKLNGCPMDGGGVVIDKQHLIHTVWQREGVVYYNQPGQSESKIADGRGAGIFGNETPFMTWNEGAEIFGQPLVGDRIHIGEGKAVTVIQLKDDTKRLSLLAAWEKEGKIQFRKLD